MKEKNLCVIPARLGSSRFPNKPLIEIAGMPMIGHVALRCKLDNIFDRVVVATCDVEIANYCQSIDVEAIMTSNLHERASDRVQEAAVKLEQSIGYRYETVTLVQGDEPLVEPIMLSSALEGLLKTEAKVVNLASPISNSDEFNSENCVKVVVNIHGNAMYFSRATIPYRIKKGSKASFGYKQVCIIPFERDFLDTYSSLEPTNTELIESIDMNRVIEHGYDVHCVEIDIETYPVDVPGDIKRVEEILAQSTYTKHYVKT